MLAPFAAGLVIYWAWSNTLSIAQQYTIMRRHGTPIGSKAKPKQAVAAVAGAGSRRWPAAAAAAAARRAARARQEGLMADQKPEAAHAGRDRGGAQALRRALRVRGGRRLVRLAARHRAARGRLRRPLQCRQVEPGQCADRPAHAGPRLGEPRPHAADQFLRPRRPPLPGRPAGLRLRRRSRGR